MFYFTFGVVLVRAPISYDSLVYLQHLSEQCLLDRMQVSGHNDSDNCLLKVLVRKNIPKPRHRHSFMP